MGRHGGRVFSGGHNKFAMTQRLHGHLNGTFGETCFVRDHAETHGDRAPALPRAAAKEEKINQKGGGLLIVRDQITHENIEQVSVHRDGCAVTRHGAQSRRYTVNRTRLFGRRGRSPLDDHEEGDKLRP
jgi:hypothetical protein